MDEERVDRVLVIRIGGRGFVFEITASRGGINDRRNMPRVSAIVAATVLALLGQGLVSAHAEPGIVTVRPVAGDPTAGIQAALASVPSGGGIRLVPGENYPITKAIRIPRGVSLVDGAGARLTVRADAQGATPENAIVLRSEASGLRLTGLGIDLSGAPQARGILASAVEFSHVGANSEQMHDVTISNVSITGAARRGIDVVAREGDVRNLTIADNIIVFANGATKNAKGTVGISITSTPPTEPQAQWEEFTRNGQVIRGRYSASQVTVTGNRVDGGYYGVGFDGVVDSTIKGNRLAWNVRNISAQNESNRNLIEGNHVSDCESASIHLAYKSSGNTVRGNTVITRRAHGEALLQAYQGSENNTFDHNLVYAVAATGAGPKWAFQASTGSNQTTFRDNIISAQVQRAVMVAESIWDGDSAHSGYPQGTRNPYSYLTDRKITNPAGKLQGYMGGSGSLDAVSVTGNILYNGTDRPLVYIGAEASRGRAGQSYVGNVTGLSIRGNAVIATPRGARVERHEGQVPDLPVPQIVAPDLPVGGRHDTTFSRSGEVFTTNTWTLGPADTGLWLLGGAAAAGQGNDLDNRIVGNPAANALLGGGGNDQLYGGLGADTLTGGPGRDRFVMEVPLPAEPDQVDRITDFVRGQDRVVLPRIHFGPLTGAWFTPSGAERTAQSRIHQQGDTLYYDPDGSGNLFAPVPFASLTGQQLSQDDFDMA